MRPPARAWLTALALATALGCSGSRSSAPVYSTGTTLVDQQGRSVILRGVNLRAAGFFDAYKGNLPLPPFGAADCRVLGQDFGMNSLRLPISWSYLEPTRGNFDSAFIARILQLAADCAQEGVYTLVDLHQDSWSKYVGSDGAPLWAHDPSLPAADSDEHEGNQSTSSAAVEAAFEGFFADGAGLMQDYATMAAHLARAIDKQPGIIGLELMNEPLASPGELAAFYGMVAPAVRAAAPGLPVYFEPGAIRNVLDAANPDPLTVENTVYSPHLYTGVFQGNWMPGQAARIDASISSMLIETRQARAALMVTEFGQDPVDPTGAAWLTAALDLLDRHIVSASLWVYEEWPSTCGNPVCWGLYDEAPVAESTSYARTLRPAAVTLLARGFPQAIAGRLDSFAWDAASRTLTVQLEGTTGTHVLAAPALVYPGNVSVTCDGRAATATRHGSRVEVSCAGKTLVLGPAS